MNPHKSAQIEHYDHFRYNVPPGIFDRVKRYHAKNILHLIPDRPGPEDRILYVACGTGHEIQLLGYGIGTDISFNCIRKVIQAGFPGIVSDVENLPFASNSFDYVFSNSFHHFDDFEKSFSEIYRVCRKGGRIVLGPESHRYSIDQYFYNTLFRYWNVEKRVLQLTPRKLIHLFRSHHLTHISFYHKGIDLIAIHSLIENLFDRLTEALPDFLFFWAHFYITGIK